MGKLFGTNGVRGTINDSLTVDMIINIAKAVGTVIGPGTIAISRDSRMGGEMFQQAAIAGLLSTGCSVVDVGLMPTPGLQYMTKKLECDAGAIITASHNPPQFNGIKVMGSNGIEITRELENEIENVYFNKSFRAAMWDSIGRITTYGNGVRDYINAIKKHVDVDAISSKRFRVVIDGANSVGSLVTPILLRELGCKVVSINSQLDGMFPGRDPEPLPKNLENLSKIVKSVGADVGVAHDGDADRATFVDTSGRILWGDQSFAIIAKHILQRKKGSTLVTPVSSGRLIEDIAKHAGAKIEWTEVGSVVVSHKLVEIDAELGGEENGGVFYPPHLAVRDGAMTAAQLLEIMALRDLPLDKLVEELPQYYSTKKKVPVPPEKKESILDALLELTKDENRITLDGVKLEYDEGWILIRPSGTEPLYRAFSESTTQQKADELCQRGIELIEKTIEKV